jgi:quercetin dioxygenase-like cupin family protein
VTRVVRDVDLPVVHVGDIATRRSMRGKNLLIARYEVKAGNHFENHVHPEEQMGYVISGRVEFRIGPQLRPVIFEAGTFFHFSPNERHDSLVLADAVVIDVFSPPRAELAKEALDAEGAEVP